MKWRASFVRDNGGLAAFEHGEVWRVVEWIEDQALVSGIEPEDMNRLRLRRVHRPRPTHCVERARP